MNYHHTQVLTSSSIYVRETLVSLSLKIYMYVSSESAQNSKVKTKEIEQKEHHPDMAPLIALEKEEDAQELDPFKDKTEQQDDDE